MAVASSQGRRRRGRPPHATPTVKVAVVLRLHPNTDQDLLAWFSGMSPRHRPAYVKAALRQGGLAATTIVTPLALAVSDEELADLLDDL